MSENSFAKAELTTETGGIVSDLHLNYRKAAAGLDYFDFSEIKPIGGENNMNDALDGLLSVSRVVFD